MMRWSQQQTKLNSFQEESSAILSVFTTTLDRLKALNTKVNFSREANTVQINKLQEENLGLEDLLTKNNSIIEKINHILS